MSIKDTINENWKQAFKARDNNKKSAYDLIKQRILVAEKSGQFELPLTDEQIINLIIKEVKEREELLSIYKPGDEIYDVAKVAVEEFAQFLPKQMTEDEVVAIIKRIKATESNTGKIIGLTIKEIGNQFDKAKIAALVKSID